MESLESSPPLPSSHYHENGDIVPHFKGPVSENYQSTPFYPSFSSSSSPPPPTPSSSSPYPVRAFIHPGNLAAILDGSQLDPGSQSPNIPELGESGEGYFGGPYVNPSQDSYPEGGDGLDVIEVGSASDTIPSHSPDTLLTYSTTDSPHNSQECPTESTI